MHLHWQREEFARLRRGMRVGLDCGTRDLPDRGRKLVRPLTDPRAQSFGFLTLDPAEEAWLVLPQIHRVRQHRTSLDPDDLLVHERAKLRPDALQHRLAFAGVPAEPGGI